jgi:hypothetical protein
VAQHVTQLLVAHVAERPPRRDLRSPQGLGLPHVPDPGDEPLVEQRVAHLATRVLTPEPGHDRVEVGRRSEDVGTHAPNGSLRQLEHRPVDLDGLEPVAAQDEPRAAEDRRPPRAHEPTAPHAQVTAEHDAALEAEEQVLADGLDGFEQEAVDAVGHARDGAARMRRLGLEALSDERLQSARGAVDGIALRHATSVARASRIRHPPAMPGHTEGRLRDAAAGAVAATVWGVLEPLDRRLLRSDYSDIALLGKTFTRGRAWRPLGFALHAANGTVFGLAFHEARRITGIPPPRLALAMALAEHVASYPLSVLVDRYHPARRQEGIPPLATNPRAFLQATWRHAVFGVVLGLLGAQNRSPGPGEEAGLDEQR